MTPRSTLNSSQGVTLTPTVFAGNYELLISFHSCQQVCNHGIVWNFLFSLTDILWFLILPSGGHEFEVKLKLMRVPRFK